MINFSRRRRRLFLLIGAPTLILALILPLAAFALNYQVAPGDSLWKISQRFKVSTNTLKQVNNLSGDTIYPGQVLYVPDQGSGSPNYAPLRQQLEDFVSQRKATYGIYFKDLISGKTVEINAYTPIPAASTVKLPTVLYLNTLAAQGKIDWQTKLAYQSQTDYQGGSGIIQFGAREGDKYTLRTLATMAITTSDNIAYRMLVRYLGQDSIANYMRNLGAWTVFPDGKNLTTARDMGVYLQAVLDLNRQYPAVGRRLIDDMANGIYNEALPLYLPDSVTVAHKEGFIWGVCNDVGIVYGSRPYIIAVLSQGQDNPDQGFADIAEINRMIYDYQEQLAR
ncbi:MAG: serine hydrolase [Clostridia bacterium]|nr:serine hydrolase [Clostridia bacterium]